MSKKRPSSGRPTKYRKEFCELLIQHMSEGLSFDTFAGVLRVNPDTLYEWAKVHPEFSESKKVGNALRNLLVEKAFVSSTLKPGTHKFNTAQMIYWTKNTLGWSDRVEQQIQGAGTLKLAYNLDDEPEKK